jgi:hypothetical protein
MSALYSNIGSCLLSVFVDLDLVEAGLAPEQPADPLPVAAPTPVTTASTSQPAAKRLRRFFELFRMSGQ